MYSNLKNKRKTEKKLMETIVIDYTYPLLFYYYTECVLVLLSNY